MCQNFEFRFSGSPKCRPGKCDTLYKMTKICLSSDTPECRQILDGPPREVIIPTDCLQHIDDIPELMAAKALYDKAIKETPTVLPESLGSDDSGAVGELVNKFDHLDDRVKSRVLLYEKVLFKELLDHFRETVDVYMKNGGPAPGRDDEYYKEAWKNHVRDYINFVDLGRAVFRDDGEFLCGASPLEQPQLARNTFWRWEEAFERFPWGPESSAIFDL
ncbi:hypothetical protein VTK26DRAFT_3480 [Humicola hyalothermophila]